MARVMAFISRGLALWVLLGAGAAYACPEAFAWTQWPISYVLGGFVTGAEPVASSSPYDLPGRPIINWMFALTMFSVGTVIDPGSFAFLARHPLSVALGLATQFSVMPTLAYVTARAAGFDDDIALGFIIVGCAPGAMTSNVLTYLAKGDTAYSVTLTTLASILAVVLTPTLVKLLAGAEMGVTAEKFWAQLWTIAWTVATPLLLGLGLRVAVPRGRKVYDAVSPAVAVVAIVIICCFVIQWTHTHLEGCLNERRWSILFAVAAINGLGFVVGNLLARLYRLSRPQRVTLTIEIGMQNAGMGVVLAATTFADRKAVAIPAALFTIWCIWTAAGLIAGFKRREAAEVADASATGEGGATQ